MIDTHRHEKYKLRLAAERNRRSSFMNNTKWYELFYLINNERVNVRECYLKCLLYNDFFCRPIPQLNEFDRFGILDGHGGPLKYYEIEFIEINSQIEVTRNNREELLSPLITQQDIDAVSMICKKIGKLEIDYSPDDKIRIYGYK